jgi:hypothetical protein
MRFVEVVLLEPEKNVVALADAYFFPPFQPSLLPRTKGGPVIPSRLPPRRARLVVYNKQTNETSIWVVELSEVHAATRGGHHIGKVISSEVVPDVQPAMVYLCFCRCLDYSFLGLTIVGSSFNTYVNLGQVYCVTTMWFNAGIYLITPSEFLLVNCGISILLH